MGGLMSMVSPKAPKVASASSSSSSAAPAQASVLRPTKPLPIRPSASGGSMPWRGNAAVAPAPSPRPIAGFLIPVEWTPQRKSLLGE